MKSLFVKRLMDIVIATTLFLLSSPLLLFGILLTFLSIGRPIFFNQVRPGKDAKLFKLYKLRTMREGDGTDEERLSTTGKFIRASSIDELPQFINVVLGQMSLVGPRPLHTQYLELYSPHQARRHEMKPGITGWAQINGRNKLSWPERFDMDVWYVDNWSIRRDVEILLKTAIKTVRREGISSDTSATVERFTGNEDSVDRPAREHPPKPAD